MSCWLYVVVCRCYQRKIGHHMKSWQSYFLKVIIGKNFVITWAVSSCHVFRISVCSLVFVVSDTSAWPGCSYIVSCHEYLVEFCTGQNFVPVPASTVSVLTPSPQIFSRSHPSPQTYSPFPPRPLKKSATSDLTVTAITGCLLPLKQGISISFWGSRLGTARLHVRF